MKEIKEVATDIREMLEEAECYAREANKHKTQYPELARVYNQISMSRVSEINSLHDQVTNLIDRTKRDGQEVPASMLAIWDWEHDLMIEKMADIKRLQDMYKG